MQGFALPEIAPAPGTVEVQVLTYPIEFTPPSEVNRSDMAPAFDVLAAGTEVPVQLHNVVPSAAELLIRKKSNVFSVLNTVKANVMLVPAPVLITNL